MSERFDLDCLAKMRREMDRQRGECLRCKEILYHGDPKHECDPKRLALVREFEKAAHEAALRWWFGLRGGEV